MLTRGQEDASTWNERQFEHSNISKETNNALQLDHNKLP